MPCEEASRREDHAFKELYKAIGRRARVNASVAAYTEHWESYEAAVETVLVALREYELAAHALLDRRAQHAPVSGSARV